MASSVARKTSSPPISRAQRFKQALAGKYFVRLHMSLAIAATTMAGLGSSKLLLMAGVTSVLVRYPLAVLGAYGVFLLLMRGWIAWVLPRRPAAAPTSRALDLVPDNVDGIAWSDGGGGTGGGSPAFAFGGGDSGGGGASDSWGAAETVSSSSGSSLPDLDLNLDLDDNVGWILLALAALLLVFFGAAGYLVWAAPQILPDVAFQALLAGSLTRAAERARCEGWLHSAFRCTWIPFTVVLLMVCGLAYAVHRHCPEAPKLMDALQCEAAVRRGSNQ